jgi:hypothetical protein
VCHISSNGTFVASEVPNNLIKMQQLCIVLQPSELHLSKDCRKHSPYICIVLYRVTLVQDPVLAYARAAASCTRVRLKPGFALRLLLQKDYTNIRAMLSAIFTQNAAQRVVRLYIIVAF